MSRAFTPKVVTASDLVQGDVVYLTAAGGWTRRHADAELICDAAHAEARLALAEAQANTVVSVYLADARPGPRGPEPVHFREAFRARGPSNHFHGKQAEAANV